MHFLLASLHRPEYRAMVSRIYVPPGVDPVVLHVACPTCGLVYVAEIAGDVDPWDMEDCEDAAVTALSRECPDHPHRFVVQP